MLRFIVIFFALILAVTACEYRSGKEYQADAKKPIGQDNKVLPEQKQHLVKLASKSAGKQSYQTQVKGKEGLKTSIEKYYQRQPSFRAYIQVDKPLYQPGETIWVKTTQVASKDLRLGRRRHYRAQYRLINPRGVRVSQRRVSIADGTSACDIPLAENSTGGEYTISVFYDGVKVGERKIIINNYQPPRLKKKLEFVRKAYGSGDEVQALLQVHRATGEALANHKFAAVVQLQGQEIKRLILQTDARGQATVRFTLPQNITKEDGSLNILIAEGGITESIARPIPLVLEKLQTGYLSRGW